jgi:hypothetical protein
VSRLRSLNMPYTLDTFRNAHVDHLVEGLLRSSSSKVEGVALVVDLCLHFRLYGRDLWTSILKQMQRLDMLEALERALVQLNHQPHLWHLPAFLQSWDFLLQRSLARTVGGRSSTYKDAASILRSCPVISKLDLKALWAESKRLHDDATTKILEQDFKAYLSP